MVSRQCISITKIFMKPKTVLWKSGQKLFFFFFFVTGWEVWSLISLPSGSECLPLPLVSPVCSASCSSPPHSLLSLPKSKTHPILLFRAIPLCAAMTANRSADLLLCTQMNQKLAKQSLCALLAAWSTLKSFARTAFPSSSASLRSWVWSPPQEGRRLQWVLFVLVNVVYLSPRFLFPRQRDIP